jgi:hypothetical protein
VAIVAGLPLTSVFTGVDREAVVEDGAGPDGRVVTALAGFREASREVIRIGYGFIFLPVA